MEKIDLIAKNQIVIELVQTPVFIKGDKGEKGDSLYDLAVQNGFVGTIEDWVANLSDQGTIEWSSSDW